MKTIGFMAWYCARAHCTTSLDRLTQRHSFDSMVAHCNAIHVMLNEVKNRSLIQRRESSGGNAPVREPSYGNHGGVIPDP
jgi:hypothetical protein